jgi:hypothetical protein
MFSWTESLDSRVLQLLIQPTMDWKYPEKTASALNMCRLFPGHYSLNNSLEQLWAQHLCCIRSCKSSRGDFTYTGGCVQVMYRFDTILYQGLELCTFWNPWGSWSQCPWIARRRCTLALGCQRFFQPWSPRPHPHPHHTHMAHVRAPHPTFELFYLDVCPHRPSAWIFGPRPPCLASPPPWGHPLRIKLV